MVWDTNQPPVAASGNQWAISLYAKPDDVWRAFVLFWSGCLFQLRDLSGPGGRPVCRRVHLSQDGRRKTPAERFWRCLPAVSQERLNACAASSTRKMTSSSSVAEDSRQQRPGGVLFYCERYLPGLFCWKKSCKSRLQSSAKTPVVTSRR